MSALRRLCEEVDVLAFGERHDSLLPVLELGVAAAHAAILAAIDHRVHVLDLDVEHLLNGFLDLDLVRAAKDFEHDLVPLAKSVALLREEDRPTDDGLGGNHFAPPLRQRSSRALAASFERTSVSWRRRS